MTTVPDPPHLHVSLTRSRKGVVVRLEGELDCATAPQLDDVLRDLPAEPRPVSLLVDAERLDFADVAGLRPLIDAAHRLARDGSIHVQNAPRPVARVIDLLGVGELLGVDG